MAELERLARDAGERVGVGGELAQHAGAAFGRLVEEELAAEVAVRERLDGELGVLEVERDLDRALQRRGERRHRPPCERPGGLEEQCVAAILDVRDDALLELAHRVLAVLDGGLGVRRPVAAFGVEDEAERFGFLRRVQPTLIRQSVAAPP